MHREIKYFDPRATSAEYPAGQYISVVVKSVAEYDDIMAILMNPERGITDIQETDLPPIRESRYIPEQKDEFVDELMYGLGV